MTGFSFLTAVSAQALLHILLFFLCILPLSLYVVLWDGSAGCFLRLTLLFVVSRIRPVAELVVASHTQVLALFSQLLFGALVNVLVDRFVFATIFFYIRFDVKPAQTAFRTASTALALSEA